MHKILVLCTVIMGLSVMAMAQPLPPKQSYSLDVRQVHSGHSLTDPLFGQPWPGQYVNLMTELRGEWAGDDIGKSTIPGSPMFWRWEHDHELEVSAKVDIADWELLVITESVPLPRDWEDTTKISTSIEHLGLYAHNAWNNGNGGQGAATLLWTTWTNIDDSDGPWRSTLDNYETLWELMVDSVNSTRPAGSTPIYIIPGHKMMARIYDDIENNKVPDVSHISDIFSDNIHTNSLGAYAVAMIHYACIYNTSPVGLPTHLMDNPPAGFQFPSDELALYFQEMIWDVVTSYPRTGIKKTSSADNLELNPHSAITLFPNPVKSVLNVANSKHTNHFRVFNNLGQLIMEGTGKSINLSMLPSGIYSLQIGAYHQSFIKE